MPRYNVYNKNIDKWACFSSVVDDFITDWMPLNQYEKWRDAEYGKNKCPLEQANKISLEETLEIIGREDI